MNSEKITLHRGDITKLHVDAIVNAANAQLTPGGGVGNAIHAAAGPELREECAKLPACREGDAVITGAYRLPAKHVIHAVGPSWHGGKRHEAEKLARTYQRAFALAAEHDVHTIAFPAISCGTYSYPVDEAARIAIDETLRALRTNPKLEHVTFALFTPEVHAAFAEALAARG